MSLPLVENGPLKTFFKASKLAKNAVTAGDEVEEMMSEVIEEE